MHQDWMSSLYGHYINEQKLDVVDVYIRHMEYGNPTGAHPNSMHLRDTLATGVVFIQTKSRVHILMTWMAV